MGCWDSMILFVAYTSVICANQCKAYKLLPHLQIPVNPPAVEQRHIRQTQLGSPILVTNGTNLLVSIRLPTDQAHAALNRKNSEAPDVNAITNPLLRDYFYVFGLEDQTGSYVERRYRDEKAEKKRTSENCDELMQIKFKQVLNRSDFSRRSFSYDNGEGGDHPKKEIHYHQHKHLHEHSHLQEHKHNHKDEHKAVHHHDHKAHSDHKHHHKQEHDHHHKAEHHHKVHSEHKHEHHQNHRHYHKGEHNHNHHHKGKHGHWEDHSHKHKEEARHSHEEKSKHDHYHHHEHKHHAKHHHKHNAHHQHEHHHSSKHQHKHKIQEIYRKVKISYKKHAW